LLIRHDFDRGAAKASAALSALKREHVRVDSLFFSKGQSPPLGPNINSILLRMRGKRLYGSRRRSSSAFDV
jgi:hypothetical protein